ncbi:MAG: GntR family transcriptional regulator [Hyphomicrobiaceae bacterium]
MTRIPATDGINRRYLHDIVADRLRQLILDGELEPRSRVNELELAERFAISRTPLREAIKILATEGLLELLPNRGARVASISDKELDDVLEVVASLEALAGDLACRHATAEEIAQVATLSDEMADAWRRRDEATYFRLNRQIHDAVMAASRNAVLATMYANLSGRIQRARYTAHKTDDQWARAMQDHREMAERLQARDGAGLADLLRRHIRSKKDVIAAAYG